MKNAGSRLQKVNPTSLYYIQQIPQAKGELCYFFSLSFVLYSQGKYPSLSSIKPRHPGAGPALCNCLVCCNPVNSYKVG